MKESLKVGVFWVVEEKGAVLLLAQGVPLDDAKEYGGMLTDDLGHFEYWSMLAARGAYALTRAGLPSVPVWSEYEEWPRGRVLYDLAGKHFVIRADRQLHQPRRLQLIAEFFGVDLRTAEVALDDHYVSVRQLLRINFVAPKGAQ